MGTKDNSFLARQEDMKQRCFVAGCEITAQQMFDMMCLALHDPAVMGKDVFGPSRLEKVHDAMYEYEKMFHDAWVFTEESDYLQEKLDAALREIFGKNIAPFQERYPLTKKWNYFKRTKK